MILFGGKGGVGKTTVASLAALHFSQKRRVVLFSTDPASNLDDLIGRRPPANLTIEALDASKLYQQFLDENLVAFLELGDRGTYLDRDELQRFFELSIPGIDELMAWLRIGELAQQREDLLIVDTAPTGHTLRMLSSSGHFGQLEKALALMQAKHRDLVEQLSRRRLSDAMDEFLAEFGARLAANRELLGDQRRAAFAPVFLAEPLVIDQTRRLIEELRTLGLAVPFAILNQAPHDCDCARCREQERVIPSAARDLGGGSVEAATQTPSRAKRGIPRSTLGMTIVTTPRACVQLDSLDRLKSYLAGRDERHKTKASKPRSSEPLELGPARLVFFAGKGGVGKTSAASSVALQRAARSPRRQFTLISVDPAHSMRDLFESLEAPANLSVEFIDTKEQWNRLRQNLGEEIERAIGALTPKGVSVVHDTEVMQQLVEIAPPGADELFAIMRLSDLSQDETQHQVFVDTAPTGHFLRLLELPASAGEWVREFMRLLLKYKELIPAGSLGEQLVQASRALKHFEELLRSEHAGTVVVTRPDRIVAAETKRLLETLRNREMRLSGIVANYVTPETDCSCDQSRRAEELEILGAYEEPLVMVERRPEPPTSLEDLRSLIPLRQDSRGRR